MLLNIDLIKLGDLAILNSINNEIQFSMKLSDNKFPFLDMLMTNSVKKMWVNIYSKLTDSKHYVSYLSDNQKPFLKNIPFCLA